MEQIKVHLRIFGSLAQIVGDERSVELTSPATVVHAIKGLGMDHSIVSIAIVNGSQATMDTVLGDEDSVMLIPPVTGG